MSDGGVDYLGRPLKAGPVCRDVSHHDTDESGMRVIAQPMVWQLDKSAGKCAIAGVRNEEAVISEKTMNSRMVTLRNEEDYKARRTNGGSQDREAGIWGYSARRR